MINQPMKFKVYFKRLSFFLIILTYSSCKSIINTKDNLIKVEESYHSKFFHTDETLVEEESREYVFNQEGKLMSLIYLNQPKLGSLGDNNTWVKIEKSMEYDSFGKIKNIKTYGYNFEKDKELLKSIKMEYNSGGDGIHKLLRENYLSNKQDTCKIILNENSIIVESQDLNLIETYTLNDKNNVINYVRKHKMNNSLIVHEEFKDYKENTIKVNYGDNYSEDLLNFDEEGDLIEMLKYDKDQLISKSRFRYQDGFINKVGINNYPGYLTSKNEEPLEVVGGESNLKYKLFIEKELGNQDKLIDEINKQIIGMRFTQYPKKDLLFLIMFFKS